jgi:hypothetical protein
MNDHPGCGDMKRLAAKRSEKVRLGSPARGVCYAHGISAFALFAAVVSGCQLANNPFRDDLSKDAPVSTASADSVRARQVSDQITVRGFESMERNSADGSVIHWPTWFEDPYEENGSNDGKFAWTGEDYWHMVYWRARFLVELVVWPISAIVEPPWRVMASDGNLARRCCGELHDVERRDGKDCCGTSRTAVSAERADRESGGDDAGR